MRPIWNASQRGVLLGLLVGLLIYLSIRFAMNPMYVSDPPPLEPARLRDLPGGIDPNIADEPTLAALPIIGPNRARDIVAYRNEFAESHPHEFPFQKPEDLMNVKGIGPATVDALKEFLIFPNSSPSPGTPGELRGDGSIGNAER